MANRFEILETMKTAFGTKGRLLGAWVNKAGTEIMKATDADVSEVDLDAGKGLGGALTLRETLGLADRKVRVFLVPYLEFISGIDAAVKKAETLYVADWGTAKEKAYWLTKVPEPKQAPSGAALKTDLTAHLEKLIGKVPPGGFTGTKILGYIVESATHDKTCFDVSFRIKQIGGGIQKVSAIICMTAVGPPHTFSTNTVVT